MEERKRKRLEQIIGCLIYSKSKIQKQNMGRTIEEQIHSVCDTYMGSDKIGNEMKTRARKIVDDLGISITTVEHVVKTPKAINKVKDAHFKFPEVLSAMTARLPLAIVGPAGSFKTSTVEKAAAALGLSFYSKSVSLQTGIHEFFGYQDANGNYVTTLFRKAYEEGGVFLLDEFDAGNPNVLVALNQATANTSCAFADGMIKKHPDFILVMAGNTYGTGATREYIGRNQIDAATLDRFVFLEFPYDEDLEKKICGNLGWFKTVKQFRDKAAEKKVKVVISPRASILGASLIAQGMNIDKVIDLVIFKGMSEQERNLLS